MKASYRKTFAKRKQNIEQRLDPARRFPPQHRPFFRGRNLTCEMSGKIRAINCGGIGAIHTLVSRIGLCDDINRGIPLLRFHLPYSESDHVLNIAYNCLLDGHRLQDIELRRNDEAFLDAIGAERIPDPTTSGDFTRRFDADATEALMEAFNTTRKRVWDQMPKRFLGTALIDVDGTIANVTGECKQGMGLSYKGVWGYAPLIVSLANTNEVLYLKNRPGNTASHTDCIPYLRKAVELVKDYSTSVMLRGDTDFGLTKLFDEWESEGVDFVFGMDASPTLKLLASELPVSQWKKLKRLPKYEIKTQPRSKMCRYKEAFVEEKGYKNQVLVGEDIACFDYQPNACEKSYRFVVVRKNITVKEGKDELFDDVRYFFYVTNNRKYTNGQVVTFANQRCNQENVVAQLKSGVGSMRMPVHCLQSNWAYMVMASVAWNLKSSYGLLMLDKEAATRVVKMEFRSFKHRLIQIPAQIIVKARSITYRILSYTEWVPRLFDAWLRFRRIRCT